MGDLILDVIQSRSDTIARISQYEEYFEEHSEDARYYQEQARALRTNLADLDAYLTQVRADYESSRRPRARPKASRNKRHPHRIMVSSHSYRDIFILDPLKSLGCLSQHCHNVLNSSAFGVVVTPCSAGNQIIQPVTTGVGIYPIYFGDICTITKTTWTSVFLTASYTFLNDSYDNNNFISLNLRDDAHQHSFFPYEIPNSL